jgi:hypothetical protein
LHACVRRQASPSLQVVPSLLLVAVHCPDCGSQLDCVHCASGAESVSVDDRTLPAPSTPPASSTVPAPVRAAVGCVRATLEPTLAQDEPNGSKTSAPDAPPPATSHRPFGSSALAPVARPALMAGAGVHAFVDPS